MAQKAQSSQETVDSESAFRWYHHAVAIIWALLAVFSGGAGTSSIAGLVASLGGATLMAYLVVFVGVKVVSYIR